MTEITQVLISPAETPRKLDKRERAIGYLFTLLTPLCQYPQDLKIEDSLEDYMLCLNVITHKDDGGLLIGKLGAVSNALKIVMNAWGKKNFILIKLFINRHNDQNTPTNGNP